MINIKRFQKENFIGKGSFGEAYKVIENGTEKKNIYAAKIYFNQISDQSSEIFNEIKNELNILYKLNHPSIIKFIGYSMKNFEGEPKPTIIMELGQNGSLREMFLSIQSGAKPEQWTSTKKMINIYGIASGMQYLHAHNVIHRDLKPENILLNEYLYPKITDFGLSRITDDASEINNFSNKGTPCYMAPESFDGIFSDASDVYSFAIIMYEILTNDNPNKKLNQAKIAIRAIKNGFVPSFPDNFSIPYKNLILRCGSNESKNRPKFDEIATILEKDKQFILPGTDENEFRNYIEYIKEYETTFLSKNLTINFDDYLKTKSSTIPKITLKTLDMQPRKYLYPYDKYLSLNNECKRLVDEAEKNPDIKFIVGKYSIEGENGFPKDSEIGITYIKKSIKEKCVQSTLYYSKMQISGKRIPLNLKKAKERLDSIEEDKRNGEYYMLYGKLMRKERDYENAKKYFNKAIKRGNAEAMYNYGKMILYGEGSNSSKEKSLKYFEMAERNNYQKANDFLSLINVDKTNPKLMLKILVVGDFAAGKTILIESLEFRPFHGTISTCGIIPNVVYYGKSTDQTVKLIITDTAGQEKLIGTIPPKLYRDNDGIFLCYRKGNESSVPKWVRICREHNPNCKIILIETQSDLLTDEQKEESRINGLRMLDIYSCYKYILSSSITKEGIKNILKYASELAVPIPEENNKTVELTEGTKKETKEKNGCGC